MLEHSVNPEAVIMPLQKWFAGFFAGHFVWREITLFALTLTTSLSITSILARNMIYLERTYVPSMIFPLLALGYTSSAFTPTTMMVAALIVYAIKNMIKAHKQENNAGYFLNAGIALGIAPLLYAPAVVFFILLFVGFHIFKQNWRSVITAIIGYFLPLFFHSYVLWGMGENFGGTTRTILAALSAPLSETLFIFQMGIWDYFLTALFISLTVLAFIRFYARGTQIRQRAFRGYTIFAWTLFIAMSMIAFPCRNLDILPILAVPMAALIPACFNRKSGWITNLIYLGMIWSILIYNIYLLYPYLNA